MMNRQLTSETSIVRLLPYEGRQLMAFLEGITGRIGTAADAEILDAVLDKLGDANALALWLREYVVLQLQPDEAVELVKALEAALGQDGHHQDADLALSAVRTKLRAAYASWLPSETYASAH